MKQFNIQKPLKLFLDTADLFVMKNSIHTAVVFNSYNTAKRGKSLYGVFEGSYVWELSVAQPTYNPMMLAPLM